MMQAVSCLHRLNIAHRDISLQNLLLTKDRDVKLIDFGMACLLRDESANAFRYFKLSGKSYYAAPEMYLPTPLQWPNRCSWIEGQHPAGRLSRAARRLLDSFAMIDAESTGFTYYDQTLVWLKGYEAGPADMFACGVCVFILYVQLPPWMRAARFDDAFKAFERNAARGLDCMRILLEQKYRPEYQAKGRQLPLFDDACDFVNKLLHPSPDRRATVQDAVNHVFLQRQQ
eukprot:TRINITY_DN34200_c0_g1_i1.p1 TRINITY_DN34200_c0_g1~~TRINITY_DN34200_c0_g1_i1.p1  ORF type:complete len:229 (-),score=20.08 TRINITY_DN34200_c0_g1_i1:245-931(-)